MKTFLILFNFTDTGIKNIKDSPNRIKASKEKLQELGIEVKGVYALLGKYDAAWIVSAPDDQTLAKANLYIASLGNVRSETFPAFTEKEYIDIVSHLS